MEADLSCAAWWLKAALDYRVFIYSSGRPRVENGTQGILSSGGVEGWPGGKSEAPADGETTTTIVQPQPEPGALGFNPTSDFLAGCGDPAER